MGPSDFSPGIGQSSLPSPDLPLPDLKRSPGVRLSNISPPPPSLLLDHDRISGVVLGGTLAQGSGACLRVHFRSVLRYASSFHPTRPRGEDDLGAVVREGLVQLPSACGC